MVRCGLTGLVENYEEKYRWVSLKNDGFNTLFDNTTYVKKYVKKYII